MTQALLPAISASITNPAYAPVLVVPNLVHPGMPTAVHPVAQIFHACVALSVSIPHHLGQETFAIWSKHLEGRARKQKGLLNRDICLGLNSNGGFRESVMIEKGHLRLYG
jgi:hypothetical protein